MANKYLVVLSAENLELAKGELLAQNPFLKILKQDKQKLIVHGKLISQELALTKEIYQLNRNQKEFFSQEKNSTLIFKQSTKYEEEYNKGKLQPLVLSAKIAQAMVNLVSVPRKTEICDPFCGSGSILLAAAKLGHPVIGYDVDSEAIKIAALRLAGFSVKLFCKDACLINNVMHAVVTDLPYGKSTSVSSLVSLYLAFLKNTKPLLKGDIVIGFPHFVSGRRIAQSLGYIVKSEYHWYVHSSLSREILVLGVK